MADVLRRYGLPAGLDGFPASVPDALQRRLGRGSDPFVIGTDYRLTFAEAEAETPSFAFVVRSMRLDFLRPARMDDVLDVVTWPVAVKGASITLAQEVRRGGEVLVKAEVRVAFISEGRAQPIPKSLRVLMKADVE